MEKKEHQHVKLLTLDLIGMLEIHFNIEIGTGDGAIDTLRKIAYDESYDDTICTAAYSAMTALKLYKI